MYLGVSPRGSLALFQAAKTLAAMRGREFVLPDDIKTLAVPTLAHRLILAPSARLQDLKAEQILAEIIAVLRQRKALSLRERLEPIHER